MAIITLSEEYLYNYAIDCASGICNFPRNVRSDVLVSVQYCFRNVSVKLILTIPLHSTKYLKIDQQNVPTGKFILQNTM